MPLLAVSRYLEEEFSQNYLVTLAQCLEQVNSRQSTNRAFARSVQQYLQRQGHDLIILPEAQTRHPGDDQLFLSNQPLAELMQEIRQAEHKSLRETVEFLQEVVQKREARGNLWPEGRLQLGIAYATLEEYADARRVLDEVIRICESGGRYLDQQAIAA
jgi:hypothetical protein